MKEDSKLTGDYQEEHKQKKGRKKNKWLTIALAAIVAVLVIPGIYLAFIYASSPAPIRNPKLEHFHFRLQVLVDGKAENFGEDKYQQDYAKDQCNADLPEQPIHFHDGKDQFVHIHWQGMTGGMVLKQYGWNFIGGVNKALGYKMDNLRDIQKVNTHGNFLPNIPKDAKFYVYVGDEKGYQEKSFNDFIQQDLESFFGKASNFPDPEESSFWNHLFPKAFAHNGVQDGHPDASGVVESDEERLTRINNLIGNVVIFVQKDNPSDQQIKDRFNNLEPLSDSTCGG